MGRQTGPQKAEPSSLELWADWAEPHSQRAELSDPGDAPAEETTNLPARVVGNLGDHLVQPPPST